MKKRVSLSLLAILCSLLLPLTAQAASGTIFGANAYPFTNTNTTQGGNTVKIENKGSQTKIYLGATVTSGVLKEYKAHIDLENSNFTFKSFTKESGWSGTIKASEDGSGIDVDLTSSAGINGNNKLVATITLNVSDAAASTETCTMTITRVDTPTEVPETPKCQVVDGKYYDANGNEVSKEAYDASCATPENPQTGNFLPYTVIIAGIVIAAGLYFVTKKNNKIYHV